MITNKQKECDMLQVELTVALVKIKELEAEQDRAVACMKDLVNVIECDYSFKQDILDNAERFIREVTLWTILKKYYNER